VRVLTHPPPRVYPLPYESAQHEMRSKVKERDLEQLPVGVVRVLDLQRQEAGRGRRRVHVLRELLQDLPDAAHVEADVLQQPRDLPGHILHFNYNLRSVKTEKIT